MRPLLRRATRWPTVLLAGVLWLGAVCGPAAAPASAAPAVERVGGANRIETAAALADRAESLRGAPPDRALLASARAFPDGLAAGAAAGRSGDVVLLVEDDRVPQPTAEWLADHPTTVPIVVGGPARVSESVVDRVESLTGRRPQRISGADRYATAAQLAQPGSVWLASGTAPTDALAAGAAAAAGGTLLLTRAQALPEATAAALRDLAPDRVTLVGGPAAIGEQVRAAVSAVVPTASVDRVAGADRHATALAVARTATPDASAAVVTTGRTWVDALAATPVAAALDGPVLLVSRRCVPDDLGGPLTSLERVVVAGGERAVGPRVAAGTPCSAEIARVTERDLGVSWRPGCPVAPAQLRRITVDHVGFDDEVHVGRLVVSADVARDVIRVFDRLLVAGFPLQEVTTAERYGADDDRIMAANATTAMNCRAVTGRTGVWSEHSYGTAIDVNPVQNPYISASTIAPPAGRAYLDRRTARPGMIQPGDVVERAFRDIGWSWGGRWRSVLDYQHFSRSGR